MTHWAPLILLSELLQTSYSGDGALDGWGARDFLNQNSYKLRNPGMEPWTDGVPLICKSELLRTLKFEDRTAGMEPWTDGAPLVLHQNS